MDERAVFEVRLGREGPAAQAPDNANLREVFLRSGWPLHRGFARLLHCGGRARCGTCLVSVLEGAGSLSPPTPGEVRLRGPDAGRDGRRLACQSMVRGPVAVEPCG